MIRNLKALGFIFTVVLTASAAMAATAHATAATFSFGAGAVIGLVGNDPGGEGQAFSTTAGKFTCNSSSGESTSFNSSEITVTNIELWDTTKGTKAEHKCIGPLGTTTTVESSGCHTRLKPGETTGVSSVDGESTGTVDLVDTNAAPCILYKGVGCTISINAQNGINGVHYTTKTTAGGIEHVTVTTTSTNIISSHTGATCGTGEDKAGTRNGTHTLSVFNGSNAPVNITVT